MTVRTRFAPSPTGYVHIGSLRTVLYSYLWARKNHGQYILRIEDTDRTRLVEGAVDGILSTHQELGIMPDEGPHHDGGFGPYTQSDRTHLYAPRLHQMCAEGTAYYCFCTSERLSELRAEQESLKLPPGYDGHCRHIPYEEARARVEAGEKCTIRLKVPKGETIVFNDLIRGRIEFKTSLTEDAVLLKSDGIFPTYHGAVVIDDEAMGITHVMRGEEWISSIPIQVLTARALGIILPEYAHLPNVLGADGKKLSKRTGDVSVAEYLKKGYLGEALLNFLSLLGWHPKTDQEIMTMEEMIDRFEITDIHKSGAVLDPVKLDWMNGEYITRLTDEDLHSRLVEYLKQYDPEWYAEIFSQRNWDYNAKVIAETKLRLKRFDEFRELTECFYGDTSTRTDLLVNPKMKISSLDEVRESLSLALATLRSIQDFSDIESIKAPLLEAIKGVEKKNGQVLWPLRVALSGAEFSPGAFEMASILGRDESIRRVERQLREIEDEGEK